MWIGFLDPSQGKSSGMDQALLLHSGHSPLIINKPFELGDQAHAMDSIPRVHSYSEKYLHLLFDSNNKKVSHLDKLRIT